MRATRYTFVRVRMFTRQSQLTCLFSLFLNLPLEESAVEAPSICIYIYHAPFVILYTLRYYCTYRMYHRSPLNDLDMSGHVDS